jgi:hypothetical protein
MTRKISCSWKDDEWALSEVIGFVLLLGVLVTAMSLWMLYVVPVTGREDEITQMNFVKDRFTDYKISLDSLWVNGQNGVTLSTSFNLGTGGGNTQASGLFLPMLNPIASSGVMTVKDPGEMMWINTSSSSTGYSMHLTTLEYQSNNYYWIKQRYYYQTGGVFLSQGGDTEAGKVCRLSPPILFYKAKNESNIDVAAVNLVPIQVLGGSSIGGNGPVRVDSWMKTPEIIATNQNNNWVQVSVNVSDIETANMWMNVFNEARIRGGIKDSDTDWYTSGISTLSSNSYSPYIRITAPPASGSGSVLLTMERVDFVVTLNNILSGLT